MGRWSFGLVTRLDDHLLLQTGLLVRFHLVGDTFQEVLELDPTGCLRNDYRIERVPFADQIALLYLVVVVVIEFGAVGDIVRKQHDLGVGIDNSHFNQTAYHHLVGFAFSILTLHVTKLVKFQDTVVFGDDPVFGGDVGGDTTHVECPESQLCTRLTDRLGGDNTHRLTFLYHLAGSQVASVTLCTDTVTRFAGEYRTYLDPFDGRLVNLLGNLFRDLLTCTDQNFAGSGVGDIVYGDTSKNTL